MERDGGKGARLLLHCDPFLRFDGLVETFGPPSPRLHTPGKFIDDDDGAVFYHVLLVPLEERFRAHRGLQMVHVFDAGISIDIFHTKRLLCFFDTAIGQRDLLVFPVDRVIFFGYEGVGDRGEAPVERFGVCYRGRDDEWCACLIDENGIDLVDNGKMIGMLPQAAGLVFQIVAEVIKTELVVGTVRDVGRIGLPPRYRTKKFVLHSKTPDFISCRILFRQILGRDMGRIIDERRFVVDNAYRESERIIDLTHPDRIAS